MTVEEDQLLVTNGIVIWDSSSLSQSTATSIGWWRNNIIYWDSTNAGIAWWQGNSISLWENSTIWWWMSNTIEWRWAVIAWWEENMWFEGWSVVWWRWNSANSGWVVLWWMYNKAWVNSLALWSNASWNYNSFAWSATTDVNSARIDANNWILIWTTDVVSWVNLVVNWGIKLWWNSEVDWIAWEIKVVNWCFYAYDWTTWHLINRNTTWDCSDFEVWKICKFWNVELQEWDVVTAYNKTISTWCESKIVTCLDWKLVDESWGEEYKYPYCYYWQEVPEDLIVCNLSQRWVSLARENGSYEYAPAYAYPSNWTNNNWVTIHVKTPLWDDWWRLRENPGIMHAQNTNFQSRVTTINWEKVIQFRYSYANNYSPSYHDYWDSAWVWYVNIAWDSDEALAYKEKCWHVSPWTFAIYYNSCNHDSQNCLDW